MFARFKSQREWEEFLNDQLSKFKQVQSLDIFIKRFSNANLCTQISRPDFLFYLQGRENFDRE